MKKYFYLIFFILALSFYYNAKVLSDQNLTVPEKLYENNLLRFKVTGNSMSPLINNGDIIFFEVNKEPNKDNVVLIQGKIKKPAIVKRIIASENDVLGIKRFCELGDFTLLVNNSPAKNSRDQTLCLSLRQANKLKKFIDFSNGIIPKENFFVVGDNNESKDSRSFGLIERSSIFGVRVGSNVKTPF